MISFRPTLDLLGKAFGGSSSDLEADAIERWEIAPAETRFVPSAKFLPGQLERVRATEFGAMEDVLRHFRGEYDSTEGPTLGFRLKGVDLVDGVLYGPRSIRHLRQRGRRKPAYLKPTEVASGALYESWNGNRYFGIWLAFDCLTYRLAERFGSPVTTAMDAKGHLPDYEALLGMSPRRVDHIHFDELVLFDDLSPNADQKLRADEFRRMVVGNASPEPHPGVFLLRGSTGSPRILLNERVIAETLATRRGFRILDPVTASLPEIVDACAGARVVAGVEGSQLYHGIMLMPPESTLFAMMPPDRVVSVIKSCTDRQGQGYAFVIGTGTHDRFSVDWDEVDRTLDLLGH